MGEELAEGGGVLIARGEVGTVAAAQVADEGGGSDLLLEVVFGIGRGNDFGFVFVEGWVGRVGHEGLLGRSW